MSATECGCPCHQNPHLAEKYALHGCWSETGADEPVEVSEPYVGGEI